MSLLSEQMTTCVFMNKTKTADGYGGYIDVYTEGVSFKAAIVLDTSIQARVAEQEGVKNIYTVVTDKGMTLVYGDIIQRSSDGKYFKITSDGTDKRTPASASLNMRVVTAQQFIMSNGEVVSNGG